jgi:hypothetical protein
MELDIMKSKKRLILAFIAGFLLGYTCLANAQTFINQVVVGLQVNFTDEGSGIGEGSMMKFSNNGSTWSNPEPYAQTKAAWDLNSYGGDPTSTIKSVYCKVSDRLGNWSAPVQSNQVTIDNKGPDGNVYFQFTVIFGE